MDGNPGLVRDRNGFRLRKRVLAEMTADVAS